MHGPPKPRPIWYFHAIALKAEEDELTEKSKEAQPARTKQWINRLNWLI